MLRMGYVGHIVTVSMIR